MSKILNAIRTSCSYMHNTEYWGEEEWERIENAIKLREQEYEKLKAQLEKAETALRFYSNCDNWSEAIVTGDSYKIYYQAIDCDDEEFVTGYGETAGKHARDYFKMLEV